MCRLSKSTILGVVIFIIRDTPHAKPPAVRHDLECQGCQLGMDCSVVCGLHFLQRLTRLIEPVGKWCPEIVP